MTPPRLAVWLLARLLPEEGSEAVLGDLHELFLVRRGISGAWLAACWYWLAALKVLLPITRADATGMLPPPGYLRRGGVFPNLNNDVRYAIREFRRAPGFTVVAVMLLTVGIAANATVYSWVDSLLRHPVPGAERPLELVRIMPGESRQRDEPKQPFTEAMLADLAARTPFLEGVAGNVMGLVLADDGHANRFVTALAVTPGYFDLFHPRLHLGRYPLGSDHAGTAEAVVSFTFWRSSLGSDPGAIGRSIRVGGYPFIIVGVIDRTFVQYMTDIAIPLRAAPLVDQITGKPFPDALAVYGRLRPGAVLPPVRIADSAARREPVITLLGRPTREILASTLLLRRVALLVLVVAAINVSLLLIGRGIVRRREIAVRLALGASRHRIVRLLVIESLMLGIFACGCGLLLAWWTCTFLRQHYPVLVPELAMSWRAAAVAAVLATTASIVTGWIPAVHAAGNATGEIIRASQWSGGRTRSRLQRAFVVAEVALSMGLACLACLLVYAMRNAVGGEAGFHVGTETMAFGLSPGWSGTLMVPRADLVATLEARLRGIPGLHSVGFATDFPGPLGIGGEVRRVRRADRADTTTINESFVTAGYFAVMQIPLVEGAGIPSTTTLMEGMEPVWIDRALAEQLAPGRSAVGRVLDLREPQDNGNAPPRDTVLTSYRVAGIVGNVHPPMETSGARRIYRPMDRAEAGRARARQPVVVVLGSVPGAPFPLDAIAREVRAAAPDYYSSAMITTGAAFGEFMTTVRGITTAAVLTTAFALLMSFAGLYALVSFGVGQRTREIGVRVALGARPLQVLGLFFREGFVLAILGFLIGVPLTLAGIRSYGPLAAVVMHAGIVIPVIALLLLVAVAACWLPARRAMRIDPVEAIRGE